MSIRFLKKIQIFTMAINSLKSINIFKKMPQSHKVQGSGSFLSGGITSQVK